MWEKGEVLLNHFAWQVAAVTGLRVTGVGEVELLRRRVLGSVRSDGCGVCG
jgi:hypothetical protein